MLFTLQQNPPQDFDNVPSNLLLTEEERRLVIYDIRTGNEIQHPIEDPLFDCPKLDFQFAQEMCLIKSDRDVGIAYSTYRRKDSCHFNRSRVLQFFSSDRKNCLNSTERKVVSDYNGFETRQDLDSILHFDSASNNLFLSSRDGIDFYNLRNGTRLAKKSRIELKSTCFVNNIRDDRICYLSSEVNNSLIDIFDIPTNKRGIMSFDFSAMAEVEDLKYFEELRCIGVCAGPYIYLCDIRSGLLVHKIPNIHTSPVDFFRSLEYFPRRKRIVCTDNSSYISSYDVRKIGNNVSNPQSIFHIKMQEKFLNHERILKNNEDEFVTFTKKSIYCWNEKIWSCGQVEEKKISNNKNVSFQRIVREKKMLFNNRGHDSEEYRTIIKPSTMGRRYIVDACLFPKKDFNDWIAVLISNNDENERIRFMNSEFQDMVEERKNVVLKKTCNFGWIHHSLIIQIRNKKDSFIIIAPKFCFFH